MKKKKILFLTRTLGRAGVGVSLVSVLQNLDFSKFDVTLGVQFPEKELESELPDNIKVVYYGEITSKLYRRIFDFNSSIRNKGGAYKVLWKALNQLEKIRMRYKVCRCFNEVYDTANAYHQGMASKYVIQHIRAKKKIMWYHAAVIEQPWYKRTFSKADLIISDSENARKVMINEWGAIFSDRIVSLHPLIPVEHIENKANINVNLKVGSDATVIMSCGRMSPEKGMDLAAKAVPVIKNRIPELNFVWLFVGDGSELESIKEFVKQNSLDNNIVFLGYQDNPYPYFKKCDIYVQPSRLECFGITMSEALVFKKPVISTKTAGGLEHITDGVNGLLCEIDENSIADAVIRLITDKDLSDKIKKNVESNDYLKVRENSIEFINRVQK